MSEVREVEEPKITPMILGQVYAAGFRKERTVNLEMLSLWCWGTECGDRHTGVRDLGVTSISPSGSQHCISE